MKKYLVVYYSKSGNNRYLATRISKELNCDTEELKPRVNVFFFLMLSTITKISFGNRVIKHKLTDYDNIILCGPIWMGSVITPLRDFLVKHTNSIKALHFVTCCGGGDDMKDNKFGYGTVFPKVEKIIEDSPASTTAFPVSLVSDDDKDDIMGIKLTDENFKGEIKIRLDKFIQGMK